MEAGAVVEGGAKLVKQDPIPGTIEDAEKKDSRIPIMEVFGPTLQGEGVLVGVPTYFVRTGYCDYRCSWCDSKFAVNPEEVKAGKQMMSAQAILSKLRSLPSGPQWVCISGGNPAIHDLRDLVDLLHDQGFLVQVETQGSFWREWLRHVDVLTLSPKPPSSGMNPNRQVLRRIVNEALANPRARWALDPDPPEIALKIVIFDELDYEWAAEIFSEYIPWGIGNYLSVGTDPGKSTRDDLLDRGRWLADKVKEDPRMQRAHVLPQMHVLFWGHARAV
jgi:7-carboxy-7-deazaguanine synthase